MALDYVETSKKIVEAVGGASNIASAANCMTRLRLVLKDEGRAKDDAVQSIKGVKGVMRQGGQYQIIIGNEVSNLFKEFKKLGNWDEGSAPAKAEGGAVQRLFGFIAGCMTPLLPAMLGTGMLKVVLTLLTTFAGMSTESSTYILLYSFADCFFMFLPVFMGITIAKKMGGNPMLFMVVGAALCYPNLTSLMSGAAMELGTFLGMPCTYLFGIPVICSTYTSSVLPMLLMAPVMKWAENFADKVSPNVLKSFLKPLLFIIICIPCSLYVLGPIGNVIGNLLAVVFSALYNKVPWLTVGILSALMPFIVMTGMHYALVPLAMNNLATLGYDVVVAVTMFCSNIAQGGATFGVALKTKDQDTRSEGIACGISATVTGAAVSGLFCGLSAVRGYTAGGSPSFLSLICFIGGEGNPMHGVIFGAIGGILSLLISGAIAFILYKDPVKPAAAPVDAPAPAAPATPARTGKKVSIASPVPGQVVALEDIPDQTFAAGVLGHGIAVEPSEGKVYAPFDGTCESVFDTRHALNLLSEDGVELLIHVGLETVSLQGEPFKAHVKDGEKIKKGQLLLEFDMEMILNKGCKTVTPVIVTNEDDLAGVSVENGEIIVGV